MPDEWVGPCEVCGKPLCDYDIAAEAEAIKLCPKCDRVSHAECAAAHACPCQGPSDQEKLRAWKVACADGRTDG